MPQQWQIVLVKFDEWLAAINFSQAGRKDYREKLRRFFHWMRENLTISSLQEITPAQLQQYQVWLYHYQQENGRPLSIGSQSLHITALKKLYRYLVLTHQLVYNAAAELELPKRPEHLPEIVSQAEVKRLMAVIPQTHLGVRNRAIVEMLYTTGIRCGELLGLKLYDIDWQAETLKVVSGKGQKSRIIPLVESCCEAVKNYLQIRRNSNSPYLFVSEKSGRPLAENNINKLIGQYSQRAGIKKHITAHTLRHSCATQLLKHKADLRQIQQLLGHSCLTSTQRYTRVEVSDLRAVLRRCHPREQWKKD